MKLAERETDFRKLVVQRFEELPPQQQTAAEYMLEHLRDVPFLSVPELARRSGASEATIVRLAQRLGYDGFSGLKADLLEALRERVRPPSALGAEMETLAATTTADETMAAVARQEVSNIQKSLEELESKAFQQVASALFRADHVYAFGLGISAHLAELLCYLLSQIGLRATPVPTSLSTPLEQLVGLRPTDLLFVFSFPPYSRQTIELVRGAGGRGIPSVAVTDRATAPVATVARHVLTVRTENMMFTNSVGALSVLLNALVTEIAVRHRDHAVEAVSELNRLYEEDEGLA